MTSLLFHNNHSVLRLDDGGNVSQRVLFEVEVFLMYICIHIDILEHKTCDILAAEQLRLMRFDNRLII